MGKSKEKKNRALEGEDESADAKMVPNAAANKNFWFQFDVFQIMVKSREKKNRALEGEDESTDAKMVPNAAANEISRLEEQPENEAPNEDKVIDTAKRKAESYRKFILTFGSPKEIIKYKKRESQRKKRELLRWLRSPEAVIGMEDRLKGIKVNMEALEAIHSTDDVRNIPPHNMEASEAEMVYPLDRIILKGEWYFLQDIFGIVQGGSELSPDVYPRFVCHRAHKLQNAKDESSSRRIAGILSYITHLIRFKELCDDSVYEDSMSPKHKLPSIFSTKFSIMFARTRVNSRADDNSTKFVSTGDTWIPVDDEDSTMFVSTKDKCIPVDDEDSTMFVSTKDKYIAWDLRMNPKTLRSHYLYLGCKFVCENQVMVATLPVPLEFDTIKRIRRTERKRRR